MEFFWIAQHKERTPYHVHLVTSRLLQYHFMDLDSSYYFQGCCAKLKPVVSQPPAKEALDLPSGQSAGDSTRPNHLYEEIKDEDIQVGNNYFVQMEIQKISQFCMTWTKIDGAIKGRRHQAPSRLTDTCTRGHEVRSSPFKFRTLISNSFL